MTNQLRLTVVMFSFQCFHHQPVFQKKAALPAKMASPLCHHIVDLNLVGLCEHNIGLNAK